MFLRIFHGEDENAGVRTVRSGGVPAFDCARSRVPWPTEGTVLRHVTGSLLREGRRTVRCRLVAERAASLRAGKRADQRDGSDRADGPAHAKGVVCRYRAEPRA